MGRLFEKMLTQSGYQVRVTEKRSWARAADIVADAGMVIVSVPIHTHRGDDQQAAALPADCILG